MNLKHILSKFSSIIIVVILLCLIIISSFVSSPSKKRFDNFIENKDEETGVILITHKSHTNFGIGGMYAYFNRKEDKYFANQSVDSFKFQVQNFTPNHIVFENITFDIDGKQYTYFPQKLQYDTSNGINSSWCIEKVNAKNILIIRSIANANNVKLKWISEKEIIEQEISKSEIMMIRNTLEYYEYLNGKFN